jgi:hypothetical protein
VVAENLAVLGGGLLIGLAVTFVIVLPLVQAFWRRHDRRIARQIDRRTRRMDALREEW